jgi:hypothetical protein
LLVPQFQHDVNCGSDFSPHFGHTQTNPVIGGAARQSFLILIASTKRSSSSIHNSGVLSEIGISGESPAEISFRVKHEMPALSSKSRRQAISAGFMELKISFMSVS